MSETVSSPYILTPAAQQGQARQEELVAILKMAVAAIVAIYIIYKLGVLLSSKLGTSERMYVMDIGSNHMMVERSDPGQTYQYVNPPY